MIKKITEKKGKILSIILTVFFIVIIFLPIFSLHADDKTCDPSKGLCNPISANSLNDLVKSALEFAIKLGIPIIALAVVYSGFLFVSARGNSEKLEEAKRALLYTLIGAAILLGSWAIAQLISETVLSL